MELNKISNIIRNYFKSKNADIVYLFGSVVRNELREDSDIDIAVVGTYDFSDLLDIKIDLEDLINKNIDLIDFKKVDTSFQGEIISTGINVYSKDELFTEKFEMQTLSMYLTLEEDREIVFKEIIERGSVFNWKE